MHYILQHNGMLDVVFQALAGADVIYTPAFVASAGRGAVTPPAVLLLLFIQVAVGINKSGIKEAVHPGALIGQKAGTFFIAYGVMDIRFAVGDVVVAADDKWLTLRAQNRQL